MNVVINDVTCEHIISWHGVHLPYMCSALWIMQGFRKVSFYRPHCIIGAAHTICGAVSVK